ncbi:MULTISPECIES: hypothetical protein [unclassified Moorena]|uniref:hypothetical protein n=1 Tax=unclassified Moorena TaxID=2683338 RepID=UPI0013BDEDC9|nr:MULTISPECIES: hypothetical protein [unclassified Moorena]NEP34461.1 hypothetical protein [Moorena sp. SIO3B2]NEP64216.1 hypothetical protein [Moorena sp. SIO3A5]NER88100.1 hypothetical protein [Moorena sp. SIO3A2]
MWEVWRDGEIGRWGDRESDQHWRGFLPSRLHEDNTFIRGLVKLHAFYQVTLTQLTFNLKPTNLQPSTN